MNLHASQPVLLTALARSFWRNRQLITQMTKREVVGRYKGSAMGLLWSFLNPVFMLIVYIFVFSVVFKARWGIGGESKTQFAVVLFVGMVVWFQTGRYSQRRGHRSTGKARIPHC